MALPIAAASAAPAPGPLGCSGRAFAPSLTQAGAPYLAEIFEAREAHRADPAAPFSTPLVAGHDARAASVLQRGAVDLPCVPTDILTGRRNE